MADSEKPTARPESPTTARPLDFDEDEPAAPSSPAPNPPPKDEPPTKPPRPVSPREQAESTLREAFPSIDAAVVRAVLAASGGQVEPAFNALLGMTDPDSQREPEPPARPPRPTQTSTATTQSQIDADEMYARQLAEHYSNAAPGGRQREAAGGYNEELRGSRVGRPGAKPNPDDVPWRSFIDDDLPEIRDNIKKGFQDTQQTVNRWITNLRKKIDGEDAGSDFMTQPPQQAQGYAPRKSSFGRRGDAGRRSADMQRYDADPELIGDDFSRLEMRDEEDVPNPPLPERKSSRPLANPNLFKPNTPAAPRDSSSSGRKVAFQSGPPEEIRDMYSGSGTTAAPAPASATKSSKWQPLSTVDPSPVAENDPFSLGDSDDDKDAKPITLQDDEQERLERSTQEAMQESIGGDSKK